MKEKKMVMDRVFIAAIMKGKGKYFGLTSVLMCRLRMCTCVPFFMTKLDQHPSVISSTLMTSFPVPYIPFRSQSDETKKSSLFKS